MCYHGLKSCFRALFQRVYVGFCQGDRSIDFCSSLMWDLWRECLHLHAWEDVIPFCTLCKILLFVKVLSHNMKYWKECQKCNLTRKAVCFDESILMKVQLPNKKGNHMPLNWDLTDQERSICGSNIFLNPLVRWDWPSIPAQLWIFTSKKR